MPSEPKTKPYARVTIAYGDGITESTHELIYYSEHDKDDTANVENIIAAMINDDLICGDALLKYLDRAGGPGH